MSGMGRETEIIRKICDGNCCFTCDDEGFPYMRFRKWLWCCGYEMGYRDDGCFFFSPSFYSDSEIMVQTADGEAVAGFMLRHHDGNEFDHVILGNGLRLRSVCVKGCRDDISFNLSVGGKRDVRLWYDFSMDRLVYTDVVDKAFQCFDSF